MHSKTCQNCKKDFALTEDESDFLLKITVPQPTFCSLCRRQRRLMRRNERVLYSRVCSGNGKRMVSYFDENVPFPVYSREYWYGDEWDGSDYGRDYDFSRPFFEQFKELAQAAPRLQLWNVNSVNSDYSNYIGESKNCYLCFTAFGGNEDCMYSSYLTESINCVDCDQINKCERCYECFNCDTCYNCRYSVDLANCRDSWFLADCYNCSDCFGCVGLKDKQYCLWNEQLTKEIYLQKIAEIDTGDRSLCEGFAGKVLKMRAGFPHRYMHGRKNQDVTGDYVTNSNNCKNAFFTINGENLNNVFFALGLKSSMDVLVSTLVNELLYECHAIPKQNYNIKFSELISNGSSNIEYSSNCDSSSNLFACIGMRKKEYCVFNRQYTKEEYEELVPKIKEHMQAMPFADTAGRIYKYGEFFPADVAPFAYNESLAQEFFPLTKEEAEAQGFVWRDLKERNYGVTLMPANVPLINDIPDTITKETIGCMNEGKGNHNCTTAFRITENELIFYRQNKLSLPLFCPNCRHYARLRYRNGLGLEPRECDCAGAASSNGQYQNLGHHEHGQNPCGIRFETTYTDGTEIVYCESCYQQEVS